MPLPLAFELDAHCLSAHRLTNAALLVAVACMRVVAAGGGCGSVPLMTGVAAVAFGGAGARAFDRHGGDRRRSWRAAARAQACAQHARMRRAAIRWPCGRAVRRLSVRTVAVVSPCCGPVVWHARGCRVGALNCVRMRSRMSPRTVPFSLSVGRASLVCAIY